MKKYTPQAKKHRERLINLLEELFQIDQPDLDFGFYKIMHAKATAVSSFIQNDLLKIIENAFGKVDQEKVSKAEEKYKQEISIAKQYGAPNPEDVEKVKQAKEKYEQVKNGSDSEADIYEHLFHFFSRYYDSGDFLSTRYYTRETANNAATYSVPYDGREVYFHWANKDQYYTKTSEHLNSFTFNLIPDLLKYFPMEKVFPKKLKLHCQIVEAAEGEHNNNKVNEKDERYFIIHKERPLFINKQNDLTIQFEYRPDNKTTGTSTSRWQDQKTDEAEEIVLKELLKLKQGKLYQSLLNHCPSDDKKKRKLLRKYLNRYTKRNTSDYFIHKDINGFLNRELNFYIKNEIMRLDDIESMDAPSVETYLEKIKVFRKIAQDLITILTLLENFQKKLWLKKKFVTETQYCITLDRIPAEFYKDIIKNKKQIQEWDKLFAISDIKGYKSDIDINFLKNNPFLVVDTELFSPEFKEQLISTIDDLDEKTDGLLIHGDNFQALRTLQRKYSKQVDCIYIDPPYNTKSSPILYKNNYKDSSWLSLMGNRVEYAKQLLSESGLSVVAIDDIELRYLTILLDNVYDINNYIATITTHCNPQGRVANNVSKTSEYHILHAKDIDNLTPLSIKKFKGDRKDNYLKRTGGNSRREERPLRFFPILYKDSTLSVISREEYQKICIDTKASPPIFDDKYLDKLIYKYQKKGFEVILPLGKNGEKMIWQREYDRVVNEIQSYIYEKGRIKTPAFDYRIPQTSWNNPLYANPEYGSELLKEIIGMKTANTAKSIHTVKNFVEMNRPKLILDYFAGSGTTGHAVVNLNRDDGGNRKYIMVEMGNYFDTVTKPRMQKVIYSEDWKDGKPLSRKGVSHTFKYIRLESYEDTLNNLIIDETKNKDRESFLDNNSDFRYDYMLHYWLDLETKNSASLLNIDAFADPMSYKMKIKKKGSNEYKETSVDLVETFNWLIGIQVKSSRSWKHYIGKFKREVDPELPSDQETRLVLAGKIKEQKNGKWSFRQITGKVVNHLDNLMKEENVLIIWRNLTGNLEEDNTMLEEWFKQNIGLDKNSNLDVIYVNGSNNLQSILDHNSKAKVRMLEDAFHENMWDLSE